jgi:D-alanyl-D-alanine carboxypeptidase (penicillin-binding protein 5/6)
MNKITGEIGMKNSSFGNPHGLPHPQNGSTAEDMALLIAKSL